MNSTLWYGIVFAIIGSVVYSFNRFFKISAKTVPSTDNYPIVPIVVVPPVSSQEPPTAPIIPTVAPDKVRLCANAQQAFEGYWPGSSSYIHKNPGNCKGLDGKFLTFPTYEAGFAYLEDYIRRVATGKHPAYPKGGDTDLMEYTHIFTGDPEPSPTNYCTAICVATGLSPTSPMSALLT